MSTIALDKDRQYVLMVTPHEGYEIPVDENERETIKNHMLIGLERVGIKRENISIVFTEGVFVSQVLEIDLKAVR